MNWCPSSRFLISVLLLLTMNLGTGHSKRRYLYCDPDGPPIGFPFKLIHANDTDNSGFGLSCSDNNTILQLPTVPDPVRLQVTDIDYQYQALLAKEPNNCLPGLFLKFNNSVKSPIHPYKWDSGPATNITLLNCSSIPYRHLKNSGWSSRYAQDMFSCPIYAADLSDSMVGLDLLSCSKMFDVVSPIDVYYLQENRVILNWSNPEYDSGGKHKPKKKISSSWADTRKGGTTEARISSK